MNECIIGCNQLSNKNVCHHAHSVCNMSRGNEKIKVRDEKCVIFEDVVLNHKFEGISLC